MRNMSLILHLLVSGRAKVALSVLRDWRIERRMRREAAKFYRCLRSWGFKLEGGLLFSFPVWVWNGYELHLEPYPTWDAVVLHGFRRREDAPKGQGWRIILGLLGFAVTTGTPYLTACGNHPFYRGLAEKGLIVYDEFSGHIRLGPEGERLLRRPEEWLPN